MKKIKRFMFVSAVIFSLAALFVGCDKDDDEASFVAASSSDYFKPTKVTCDDDDWSMALSYNKEGNLTNFWYEGVEDDSFIYSYNPFTVEFDGTVWKDFTFEGNGRVSSFKESDRGVLHAFQFKYSGAYLSHVVLEFNEDEKYEKTFEWKNGNLVKAVQTSIEDEPYKRWVEIQYSDIPARQWSAAMLHCALEFNELVALGANYQLGAVPGKLISSITDWDEEGPDEDSVRTFKYDMNPDGSIKKEYWYEGGRLECVFEYSY